MLNYSCWRRGILRKPPVPFPLFLGIVGWRVQVQSQKKALPCPLRLDESSWFFYAWDAGVGGNRFSVFVNFIYSFLCQTYIIYINKISKHWIINSGKGLSTRHTDTQVFHHLRDISYLKSFTTISTNSFIPWDGILLEIIGKPMLVTSMLLL